MKHPLAFQNAFMQGKNKIVIATEAELVSMKLLKPVKFCLNDMIIVSGFVVL